MKHVASLIGILAVAAIGSAGQFGCAAGTTTVETGDDSTGDDDSGTHSGSDSGGTYATDGSAHADSGSISGHDSGGGGQDSGGGGFDSGGGGFDSGGGGFDSGGGGGQDTGTTTGSCPGDQSFTTQSCQTCMDSMCCSQGTACASDQDGQGLIGCLQSCGTNDTQCEDLCSEEYSDAVQEYNDLGDCLTGSCDSACQ